MFGIRFSETMAGTMQPTDGAAERRFSFTVTVQGRRAWRAALGSPLSIEGHVTIDGLVDRAPTHGTLIIDPLRGRRLVYELFWVDAQGRPQRFYGRKDLQLPALVASMTILRGTVYSQGEPLGQATLHFDLNDLPQFILGMRPTLAL